MTTSEPQGRKGLLGLRPQSWRADLLRIVLRVTTVLGGLVYLPSCWLAFVNGMWGVVVLDTVAMVGVIILTLAERLPHLARAALTSLLFYVLGAGLMVAVGSISQIYLFAFSLFATLLLSLRWGLASAAVNAVTLLGIGALGITAPEMVAPRWVMDLPGWTLVTANFTFVNLCLVLAFGAVIEALERANRTLTEEVVQRTRSEESLRAAQEREHRLEGELRQMQKMEAVGSLAGGVAHDFNNLLSVILGYSGIVLQGLEPQDPLRESVSEIQKAGQRAADLTRQLLAFSRKQLLRPAVLELNAVIAGVEKMLRRLLAENITLSIHPSQEAGKVSADEGQLEQVVVNLVVNARDAMPSGGRLTVETSNVVLDAVSAAEHADLQPGPYVVLTVSDEGVGMDRETQERIFEPFFTTKDKSRGTGLGLSTVYGIVKQSGGHITVTSAPGEGATFRVYLPRTDREVSKPATTGGPSSLLVGTETILLVEDQQQVRDVMRLVLRKAGYEVLEAANAGEALLLCEQLKGSIHLMITDVVMPHMSGRQLAERLKPVRPAMRVLYVSGYTEDTVLHHGVLEAGVEFLTKPVTAEALLRKVRHMLDSTP